MARAPSITAEAREFEFWRPGGWKEESLEQDHTDQLGRGDRQYHTGISSLDLGFLSAMPFVLAGCLFLPLELLPHARLQQQTQI